MIVTEELRIAVPDDIPVYSRAHALRRAVQAALRAGLFAGGELRRAGDAVPVLVVESLTAEDDERAIARLRQTELVLDLLRSDAWELLRAGALPPRRFDEIVVAAARCRREVVAMVVRARHRAWARLHGGAWANASSRRATSEKNSSSSNRR